MSSRPVRVLLDASYAQRAPHSGTGIYVQQLLAALAQREDVEVIAVADRARRPPAGGGLGSLRNAARDVWWVQRELPRLARAHRADIIHHPLPAFAHRTRRPQVITVHDLSFLTVPGAFAPAFRVWAARAHRQGARSAAAVICVSAATAAELGARWAITGDRVHVARHGPGQPLPAVARRAPAHFLYVGDGEPRKNLPLLLDAYRRYRDGASGTALGLILAGRADARGPGITVQRDPGCERLADLHAGAAALVHPARHEGFGLTLLESMAAGTPVLAVAGPAVNEVCGPAAWLLAEPDPAVLAAAMTTLAGDPDRREQLARAGRARVAQFSWAGAAAGHVEAYTRAVSAYP